jgi:hypothetical protein
MTDTTNIAAELERHIGKLGAPSGDTPSVMRAAAAELRRLTARATLAEDALRRTGWEHIPDACGGPVWKPPVNRAAAELQAERAQRVTLQHHAADLAQRVADLEAERDALADALHKARSSVQWRDGRLNQLQIAQVRMRDPERTMVCDILANGALLEPAGSRYATPQPAAELSAVIAERDALAARLAEIERAKVVRWEARLKGGGTWKMCLPSDHDEIQAGDDAWRGWESRALIVCPEPKAIPQPPAADHREDVLHMVGPPEAEPARQPLTREQVKQIMQDAGYYEASPADRDVFVRGLRYGERAHGIGVEAAVLAANGLAGCGACGDACQSRGSCRLADESPAAGSPEEFATSEAPRCLQGGGACEGCLMIGWCIGGEPSQEGGAA